MARNFELGMSGTWKVQYLKEVIPIESDGHLTGFHPDEYSEEYDLLRSILVDESPRKLANRSLHNDSMNAYILIVQTLGYLFG